MARALALTCAKAKDLEYCITNGPRKAWIFLDICVASRVKWRWTSCAGVRTRLCGRKGGTRARTFGESVTVYIENVH